MKPWFPLLLIVAPACFFDSSTPALPNGDGGDAIFDAAIGPNPDAEVAEVFGFSMEYEEWRVPDTGTAEGAFTATLPLNWALLDLDGDAVPEFVHTLDPIARTVWSSGAGQQHWRAYSSGPGGFVAPFEEFSLPERGTSGFFGIKLSGISETLDLDGDGHVDLVHLIDPATGQLWQNSGQLSWRIFRGGPSGFGAEEFWSLPDIGPGTLGETTRVAGTGIWTTTDITGDGIADLVHSAEPPLDVFDPKTPNWHVYVGSASGFATTATTWPVPVNGHPRGFYDTDLAGRWRTLDLDNDGSMELIQFGEIVSPFVGPFYDGTAPFWRVFAKSGNSFSSTSGQWALPTAVVPFDALAQSEGNLQWDVIDVDGDGNPDLVHTANPSSASATVWGSPNSDQWKVYLGGTDGFSTTPTTWPVPDSETETGFYSLREGEGEKQWLTVDLDGDGQVELVQTADPSTGEVWFDDDGAPYWRVFRRATE